MPDFIHQDEQTIFLTEIFNEEHASQMFNHKLLLKPTFNKIIFKNVGVKIMGDVTNLIFRQWINFHSKK